MHKRVVITKETIRGRSFRVTALMEDSRMLEVDCEPIECRALLGNVYIGKIKRIVPGIQAAFVEIFPGQMTYLPLAEVKNPLLVKRSREGKLTENDEIVVQIVKEAVKTKEPTVSTNITFQGNAVVLTTENKKLGVSKKLTADVRKHFQELFSNHKDPEIGLIIRTNAGNYSDEQIFAEFQIIFDKIKTVVTHYEHRTCYSCLYQAPSVYIAQIRRYLSYHLEKIITDDAAVYQELYENFGNEASLSPEQIVMYEDPALSLSSLYGIRYKLEDALKEKVWLKSGAYLVIQPTEALTVIDVNSGKCIKGKKTDFFLDVNLEAAEEIAAQLRLRNISGICLVDFINMDTENASKQLAAALKKQLANDSVPAVFVDFTKLGLAEITRKKIKKPLWEQV